MSFFSSIWHKFLGGKSTPWADIRYVDERVEVKNFNHAFVNQLRGKLGDLTDGKSDQEIVKLYADRKNIETEEPKLDVQHLGISDDGRIQMKLDWNQAFIRHLADNGIIAETEEEAVQQYLSMITNKAADEVNPAPGSFEELQAELHNLDEETRLELEEAARQIAEQASTIKNKRRRQKKTTTVKPIAEL